MTDGRVNETQACMQKEQAATCSAQYLTATLPQPVLDCSSRSANLTAADSTLCLKQLWTQLAGG